VTGSRRAWCVGAIAVVIVASQAASARWLVSDFETPNASTQAARSLASTGRLATNGGERLWGPNALSTDEPLRFFVLPGEPLYLAAAFVVVPQRLLRFIHVPVTTLLILSVAAFAGAFGGARLGCATALVATLDPFVVMHGPVWDDTFLAAALTWFALALLASAASATRTTSRSASIVRTLLGGVAVGGAVVTRGDAILAVSLLVVIAMLAPPLRSVRRYAMLYGAFASLTLALWGVRNHRVVGSFEIGSSHDGITLWESNGPFTEEALRRGQVMMLSADLDRMTPVWLQTQDLDEVAANRFFARRAIDYVRTHRAASLKLAARKVFLSLSAIRPELPLGSKRNLVGLMSSAALMLCAALGVYAYARSRTPSTGSAPVLLLAPLVVTGMLVLLIGPIGARYRIALDGVLWILSAYALLSMLSAAAARLRSRSLRTTSTDRSLG
jgi:hypothetical protein